MDLEGGTEVSLLTFEPKESVEAGGFEEIRERLAAEGIKWEWMRYHKRPSAPATAFDIAMGAWRVWRMTARDGYDVLHCRVHVPGLMAGIARKFMRRRPKMIFDIRGFFPEEFVDAGLWPENGAIFRAAKRVERWLMRESDAFVVLTEKARGILFPESAADGYDKDGRPVEVIPCCVDFENRFAGDAAEMRRRVRDELGLDGRRVILHLGALGGLYLTEEIADLLAAAKAEDPGTFAMFLTQSDPEKIVPLLKARGFGEGDYFAGRVAAADVQGYLEAADVGLSVVKATFATQSRSPTKIPEYLACGLPIISNRGVGDVDELIETNKVGVMLDGHSEENYREAVRSVGALGDVETRCRETARREFDLERVGGERYRRLYRRLLGNG